MSTRLIRMVLGSNVEFTDGLPFSILHISIPYFPLFVNTLLKSLRCADRKAMRSPRSYTLLFHHLDLLWLLDDDLWRALVFFDQPLYAYLLV